MTSAEALISRLRTARGRVVVRTLSMGSCHGELGQAVPATAPPPTRPMAQGGFPREIQFLK